jgi:hypothetical protein
VYNQPLINPDDYSMLLNPPPAAVSPPIVTRVLTSPLVSQQSSIIPSASPSTTMVISTGDETSVPPARLHTTTSFSVSGHHSTHIAITVDPSLIGDSKSMESNSLSTVTSTTPGHARRAKPSARATVPSGGGSSGAGGSSNNVVFPPVNGAISSRTASISSRRPSSQPSSGVGDATFVTGIDLGAPLHEM